MATAKPRTPIRRISRGSLRALSSSTSAGGSSDPLSPLLPVLSELRDQFDDLAVNMSALSRIDSSLSAFNNAFASYLYGLKVNAYTGIFPEEPSLLNFNLAAERHEQRQEISDSPMRSYAPPANHSELTYPPQSPAAETAAETTFMTNNDDEAEYRTAPSTRGVSNIKRGRGISTTSGRTRGKATAAKLLSDFAGPIIDTLPIKFREDPEARRQAEQVLGALKKHPDGLRIAEIVNLHPRELQTFRVNEILLALYRAKHVQRVSQKASAPGDVLNFHLVLEDM